MNTFRHSGKLGDIIYSLPAVRGLGGGIFYVDHQTQYPEKPPLGRDTALMMVDLLETQDCIQRADLYDGTPIRYDLDEFRSKALPVHIFNSIKHGTDDLAGSLFGGFVKELRRHLVPKLEVDLPQFHWESVGLPGRADLTKPWITGIQKKSLADLVVCKTVRYSGTLDWAELKPYSKRSIFVGLEHEWRSFCENYFQIDFYKAENLVDLTHVIAGAKLFVGNQSLGLALADAMLIPRVAQLWDESPNRMSPANAHRVLTHALVTTYIDS